MSAEFDIAVVGAGPAGANAALTAASHGLSVVMIDESQYPGGQVWRAKNASIISAPMTPETRAGDILRTAVEDATLTHLSNTRLWQLAQMDDRWYLHVLSEGKTSKITARKIVLATGAYEYVQPIAGWTLPGVLGLAGATSLFKQSLTLPGKNTIVAGSGPLVFFVASEIRRLGGTVAGVITPNSRGDWARALPHMAARPDFLFRGTVWMADLMGAGVPIRWRHAVSAIEGDDQVAGVTYQRVDADWKAVGKQKMLETDSVCLGNGLLPSTEAAQLAGLPIRHDASLGGWVPESNRDGSTDIAGVFICGDGAGIRGAAAAQIHGQIAGLSVAQSLGVPELSILKIKLLASYDRAARFGGAMTALSMPRLGQISMTEPDTIVCRCEGVKCKDILNEINAGAQSTIAVKSGLRSGMGPCGGKYCQTAIARIIAHAKGVPEADVQPPTVRAPLRPVSVSEIAGEFDYDDLPLPKPAPL